MIKFKDYFNRKFYSKVGRAVHANCKPQFTHQDSKERAEITTDFIHSELSKVENEIKVLQKRQKKKVTNSSSFLATTREHYMKLFVISR